MSRQRDNSDLKTSAPVWPCVPIKQVEVISGQVPAECRFSYGTQQSAPFTLVRLQSDEAEGWGEVRIEPDPTMIEAAQAMQGADADQLDTWLADYFDLESTQRMYAEAFSMAGHDLVARVAGTPLYQRFGKAVRTRVPLMPCLFPENPGHAAQTARAFIGRGARHLKLKLIGDLDKDLEHLTAVRSVAGASVILQGDANRGYSFRDLVEGGLASLRDAGLDVFEDPCDGTAEQYAELRSMRASKIMLDVDARSNARLEAFLSAGACDLVNLHPCQQGTLSNAVARAGLCQWFGVPVMVGGTGFTGIGTAAYHQLAGCIGTELPCGELGGHLDHGMPPGLTTDSQENPAATRLTDTPGLGVRPDLTALEAYTTSNYVTTAAQPAPID